MARTPEGPPPPPVVQRLWIRYAKRGRLRFSSHRDFQRALERAVRRAHIPVAFSAGFSPHPKISFANAAPTGMASEAEYLEIGLSEPRDPREVHVGLDAALPTDLDVLEVIEAPARDSGKRPLVDRLEASVWKIELPRAAEEQVREAVTAFESASEVPVERLTKSGLRRFDTRAAVIGLELAANREAVVLHVVLRHVTPTVRPDDLLSGLRSVHPLDSPVPARVTRLAQGPVGAGATVLDPLVA